MQILQVILLRNFLTIQKNLEYLQCASITRELTSVKKSLNLKKLVQCRFWKFKTNKATGVNNLVKRFLKDGSNTLCTPIAKICNLSIKLASFSDKCKILKIKPLQKKGLKTDPKNFRPISLLPLIFIFKIIERIIHDQTVNLYQIMSYKFQSGFRKFHPTPLVYHTSMRKSQKFSILVS